ncbi:MAG: hypothetical protein R3B89_06385 [Polyangiaceae bacterium]
MTGGMGFVGEAMKRRVAEGVCALMAVLSLFTSGCGLGRVNSRASLSARVDAGALCDAGLPSPALWGEAQQRSFRNRAAQGPVVVRQEGCRVLVLPACQVEGVSSYATSDRVPGDHAMRARLTAQARMDMPWIGAGGDASGEVSYRYYTVAHHDSSLTNRAVLLGACEGATHVVKGYSTGASQLQASTVQSGRMDNSVVRGQADASAGILNSQGDLLGCQQLAPTERVGAVECGAVIDLELAPLARLCAGHNCAPSSAQPSQPAPAEPAVAQPAPGQGRPAQAVSAPAAPLAAGPVCTSDLPACQQRCESGDRRACSALGSACTFGFNAKACELYWKPIVGLAAK